MSQLIKEIVVPNEVKKSGVIAPVKISIYDDSVVATYNSKVTTWHFKDYIGIEKQIGSLFFAYASIVFLTSVNANNAITTRINYGDNSRMYFNSGAVNTQTANLFVIELHANILDAYNDYINNCKGNLIPCADSPADEIRKLKELLDMDAITQDEFDAKKKQLLGL